MHTKYIVSRGTCMSSFYTSCLVHNFVNVSRGTFKLTLNLLTATFLIAIHRFFPIKNA